MKKLFTFFSLLLLCSACSDKEKAIPELLFKLSSDNPAVVISSDSKSAIVTLSDFIAGGNEAIVKIESNVEVRAKSNAEWCEAVISGNKLEIKAIDAAESDRSAEVSLLESGGGILGKVTVNQSSKATIEVEEEELEVGADGEILTLTVSTNQPSWDADCDADWITVTIAEGALTLSVDANDEGMRTGVVTLTAGSGDNIATAIVTVRQAANAMVFEYTLPDPSCTVILPFSGPTKLQVDWGDGTQDSYDLELSWLEPIKHNYELPGVYDVSIFGSTRDCSHGSVAHSDLSRSYITAVKAWGELGISSMENAFYNCKNLTSIPENTRNSFKEVTTFKYAFWRVPLTSIPASLFKGCSKATLFTFCFSDTKITEIPEGLLDELPNATDFNTCFSSNANLTKIPAKLFANLPKASNMSACFQLCPALTEIPAGLFKNFSAPTMKEIFYGCKALTKVPDELFAGCAATTTFAGCFQNCTALTTIGKDVFKGCTGVTTFASTFFGCTELPSVPAGIFDDCRKATSFAGTFRNCAKLASESPYALVDGKKVHLYERSLNPAEFTKPTSFSGCFYGCTSLADWNTINTDYPTWR